MRDKWADDLERLTLERGGKVGKINRAVLTIPEPILLLRRSEMPTTQTLVIDQPKASKYGNIQTDYNGLKYQSKAEAYHAYELDLTKAAGGIKEWTRQVRFYLGLPENVYVVDFVVWNLDGTTYAVDVKGVETPKFRKDKKLWQRYGPCPLHIVKGKMLDEIVRP